MVRKLIGAAAAVVLFAASAHAQVTGPVPNTGSYDGGLNWNMWQGIGPERTPEEAGREIEIERRYRETLRTKIPDKKPSNDPWRNMRAPTASSAATKHLRE